MTWLWEGRWGLGAVVLAGSLAVGCGDEGGTSKSFVGRVTGAGQDAVVGAVTDGADVSFYVCGGPTSYATTTQWLLGAASPDGSFDVSSDGWRVQGNVASGAGTLETAGAKTLSWTVRPATGALEGLYQALDGSCRTGAVVGDFGDGLGTRLQGTWCDGANRFAQVTPVKNPLVADANGIAVDVGAPASKTLVVAKLLAPLPLP